MKFDGFHPSGGDESGEFDPAHSVNRLLEQALERRGTRLRDRAGLCERIVQSNPLVVRGATRSRVGSMENWKARWGMGLAIAASLSAAVFVTDVFDTRSEGDDPAAAPSVASADQGGTISERVLVSLLAGSEVVTDSGDQEFVVDGGSAMPILRLRDASFGDLNAEVQLTLASSMTP